MAGWKPQLTYEAHMGIVYELMEEANGIGTPANTGQQNVRVPSQLLQALLPRLAPDDRLEVAHLQHFGDDMSELFLCQMSRLPAVLKHR